MQVRLDRGTSPLSGVRTYRFRACRPRPVKFSTQFTPNWFSYRLFAANGKAWPGSEWILSMASDKQQLKRMELHRAELLAKRKFSVPPESGVMAIVTMYNRNLQGQVKRFSDSPDSIDQEARRFLNRLKKKQRQVSYFPEVSVGELWELLDDVSISDLTIIGLGRLSRMHVSPWEREADGETRPVVSFYDAISRSGQWPSVEHLKLGSLYYRVSGLMNREAVNIPFGWGFMADRTKVWAAPQRGFYPSRKHSSPQDGLVRIADYFGLSETEINSELTYARAKEVFGARETMDVRYYRVPRFAYPIYDLARKSDRLRNLHDDLLAYLLRTRAALAPGTRFIDNPQEVAERTIEADRPGNVDTRV